MTDTGTTSTTTLADVKQTWLNTDALGYNLREAVLDGDRDPAGRDLVRSMVGIWMCGEHAYFGVYPRWALESVSA